MSRTLNDVADVSYGKRQNEVVDDFGRYPIIGTGGVFGTARIPLFHGPAVVVGRKGTLDSPRYVASDFWTVDTAYAVLPKDGTHAKWLYYVLCVSQLEKLNESTGVPSINRDRLYTVPIRDVPYVEQSRIAAALDTVDEVIAKTEALIAKLRQVRAGLLHDLLTRGLDENGHLRDPVAHPEQFQDSPLGRIPKAWEVRRLGDAIDMQAGDALTSESIHEIGMFPVFGGNGLRGYTDRFTHQGEYVLIGRQGALCGNIALAFGQFYATEHAVVCTPIKQIGAKWLASVLERMNLNRFSESSAQPGLSVQKISHQRIALPSFDEQVLTEKYLCKLDQTISSEQYELAKINHLKSGLMDDLLTGRVRVPELDFNTKEG